MTGLILRTERLLIRAFTDADTTAIHRVLELSFGDGSLVDDAAALEDRRSWVEWQALNDRWFPQMLQPPYGDRAVVQAGSGELIGAVGLVPLVGPFDQLPGLRPGPAQEQDGSIPEVGLFWAIHPDHRRRGYAVEAARAMIGHALGTVGLRRVLALTEHGNVASQAVMRASGMTVLVYPEPDPPVAPGRRCGPPRDLELDQTRFG